MLIIIASPKSYKSTFMHLFWIFGRASPPICGVHLTVVHKWRDRHFQTTPNGNIFSRSFFMAEMHSEVFIACCGASSVGKNVFYYLIFMPPRSEPMHFRIVARSIPFSCVGTFDPTAVLACRVGFVTRPLSKL